MPNDAKLGLIVGVAVVLAVAVVFFRHDQPKAPAASPGGAGATKVLLPTPAELPPGRRQ